MNQDILNAPKKLIEYCAKHGITEIPLCEHCKTNKVSWDRAYPGNGFNRFCSRKCRDIGRSLVIDKETLVDLRINQEKSWETIADMFGVSVTPIKKLAKQYGIPVVQYNKSNAKALVFLDDPIWLETKHKTEKLKCEDIANELGISKSTVSVYLAKHGIEANPVNAYERAFVKVSKGCGEVAQYIQSVYSGQVILNERTILDGKEIDIYLPEKKIGFEYNGVWSHIHRPTETTESRIKGRGYHVGKTELALKRDVRLFHIWSIDWQEKQDIWKSKINQILGCQSASVYARKCKVIEVEPSNARMFLERNHLMGNSQASIRLGLVTKDTNELVALMTFSPPRFNKDMIWELSRFCVKTNHSVIGGFSKLLKHFRSMYFGGIVSYADRMVSFGDVYENNGFILKRINPPTYYYVAKNSEKLLHKYQFRKQFIADTNDTRTEREIMDELGYSIIWDCGSLTYHLE